MSKKDTLILTAAIVLPGGLVALGLWKAYELLKKEREKKQNEERTNKEAESSSGDSTNT